MFVKWLPILSVFPGVFFSIFGKVLGLARKCQQRSSDTVRHQLKTFSVPAVLLLSPIQWTLKWSWLLKRATDWEKWTSQLHKMFLKNRSCHLSPFQFAIPKFNFPKMTALNLTSERWIWYRHVRNTYLGFVVFEEQIPRMHHLCRVLWRSRRKTAKERHHTLTLVHLYIRSGTIKGNKKIIYNLHTMHIKHTHVEIYNITYEQHLYNFINQFPNSFTYAHHRYRR